MELTSRQIEIIALVREKAPITGEQIAERLGLTRPAIRADLVLLGALNYIDAKPKVGYTLGSAEAGMVNSLSSEITRIRVKDVMGIPVVLRESETVSDAIVKLFLENVGSLMIVDDAGAMAGIVSRKDLLKVTMGNPLTNSVPLSLVMTRYPNVVAVSPDDSVMEAMRKMISHEIDGLPVVQSSHDIAASPKAEPVGRITKTTILKLVYGLLAGKP